MKHTEETKKKISLAHIGLKPSLETRRKLSEYRKGKPAWNKGTKGVCKPNSGSFTKKFTNEEIKEHRKTYKKGWRDRNKDRVSGYYSNYRNNNLERLKEIELKRSREPVNVKRSRIKFIYRTYGLTMEEFNSMFNKQNGKCAICGVDIVLFGMKSLNIDHDHVTGKVRGLLCRSCNRGIGQFKENYEIIKNAYEYLMKQYI